MPSARQHLWQALDSTEPAELGAYHHNPRSDLLTLLRHPPRRVLDVGCAAGAMGAGLKQRFPAVELWGIEGNAHMAALAQAHYHHVITGLVQDIDLAEYSLQPGSIDTLVLADVLEHTPNPWRTLDRLRQWLTADAQVLVSLPNARNFWLLNELAQGRWTYESSGILDITHLRFFTRDEGQRLLEQTGYAVEAVSYGPDSRFLHAPRPAAFPANLETDRLLVKNLSVDDYQQLISLQVFYRARPQVSSAGKTTDHAASVAADALQPRILHVGAPQGTGTAVLLHLFYPELWPEFAAWLRQLPAPLDVYVSVTSGSDAATADIVRDVPGAVVLLHPNRGRDIAPRLALLRMARTRQYTQLLFVHGKKSPHLGEVAQIHIPFLQHRDGDRWRRDIYRFHHRWRSDGFADGFQRR